jgi:hypothetical protein
LLPRGLSPEKIIFFRRSLGSLYALHGAALYPGAAGLIIESGPADPLERILVWITHGDGGAPLAELKSEVDCHLDQRAKIDAFGGRVLVMQSRHDDLVSVSHAERLYAWAKEPKELLIFERGDHNSILSANQKAYFVAVGDFIQAQGQFQGHPYLTRLLYSPEVLP